MKHLLPLLLAAVVVAPLAHASGGTKSYSDAVTLHDAHTGNTRYVAGAGMTYEVFEQSIEHVDLAHCPDNFDEEVVFCRMTLASEMAHVFAFAHDGAQPLVAVRSYDLAEGMPTF